MAKHRFWIVDVFGERKYCGNQLAVVLPAGPMRAPDLQAIAREFNFSETTFIGSRQPKRGGYPVRIFTPQREIPFAGHPTLGTAHVIRNHVAARKAAMVSLDLGVGRIPVSFPARGSGMAWMRQRPAVFGPVHPRAAAAALVGLSSRDLDSRFPAQEVSTGFRFLIIPVKTLEAVRRAAHDAEACRAYFAGRPDGELPILLFCPETYDPAHRLNVRVFAPSFGVPEDPATGSANGNLAGYLARYRYFGSDPVDAIVEQGYEMGRPSLLHLKAEEKPDGAVIEVGGKVIEVAEGFLA